MKRMLLSTALILILGMGCTAPVGGGGGQGGDDSGQNDNVTSNGGGGPSGQNDNADGSDSNDNGASQNDNADDSDDLPTAFRLDGVWDDNGRHVIVEQNGVEVGGTYFTEYLCDLDTGPVPAGEDPAPGARTDSTFYDFSGTLNNGEDVLPGDTITGETSFCRWGTVSGIFLAEMTLTVVDQDTLSGEWEYDEDGDGAPEYSGTIALTRMQ